MPGFGRATYAIDSQYLTQSSLVHLHQGTFDIRLIISALAGDADLGFDNLIRVLRMPIQVFKENLENPKSVIFYTMNLK